MYITSCISFSTLSYQFTIALKANFEAMHEAVPGTLVFCGWLSAKFMALVSGSARARDNVR